ncbi:HAD-IIB family hydrolase [Magnetofaba australis]|uniref:Putative Alpha,alpha-trehalose-phosphate synthase n=1 Tax=Magnetofaba australis IT-1 TaxID=1434232 RepID=A0A1Y2K550_9PROT|nr:HAD-IIB family hydrolase [Magnetofaba australis]OSM02135.1 putative Alpha,alpha-trehalose-phosphate synthase [Magnetofaba australis IT-1]
MTSPLLLCTDLDRTLLPNGHMPESPRARALFRALAAQEDVTLAYVSGRDLHLIQSAIDEYELPVPDFAVADVGSTIYRLNGEAPELVTQWQDAIGGDWNGFDRRSIDDMLDDFTDLQLQEPEKQNTYKLSYYTPPDIDAQNLRRKIAHRLGKAGVRASIIWSYDQADNEGLLDILPASANKLASVRFLMALLGFSSQQTLFAGDSGNDMDVLVSDTPAVLVANASSDVREEAVRLAQQNGMAATLHLATGGFEGMNGAYAAGILEGVNHFYPERIAAPLAEQIT